MRRCTSYVTYVVWLGIHEASVLRAWKTSKWCYSSSVIAFRTFTRYISASIHLNPNLETSWEPLIIGEGGGLPKSGMVKCNNTFSHQTPIHQFQTLSPHLAAAPTHTSNHHDTKQTTLNSAINSLNLGNLSNPNTPFSSPALSPAHPTLGDDNPNQSTCLPNKDQKPNPKSDFWCHFFPTSPMVPYKILNIEMVMDWRWGPFYHNWCTYGKLDSQTESDLSTVIMFYLDSLNRDRPKVLPSSH